MRRVWKRTRPAAEHRPGYIVHWSMPAFPRWCYFTLLATLLRPFPRPVWRLPAALIASIRVFLDADGRRLNDALLAALSLSTSRRARWRIHWSRAYQRETDLLLVLQARRLTVRWAAGHVRRTGTIPPGGAVLISPHHANQRLGRLAFATMVNGVGMIGVPFPRDPAERAKMDPTVRLHRACAEQIPSYGDGDLLFDQRTAGRKGVRLLRSGGYLSLQVDDYTRGGIHLTLLGREWWMPRGAIWFAQQSGKPLIPWMIVPEGLGWRLWIGEPIPPEPRAVIAAIEGCIRRAPGSWERTLGMPWLRHRAISDELS